MTPPHPTLPATTFPANALDDVEGLLHETDALLGSSYPGDDGSRQPVHTVYVPGDQVSVGTVAAWGEGARRAVAEQGGHDALAAAAALGPTVRDAVLERVDAKLAAEPVEDLRIDFEDGFGDRGDDAEDEHVLRAAGVVRAMVETGTAPPFVGIRFKSFEAPTRPRAIRTLDLFLTALAASGPLPDGLVLTLPKVSTAAQVVAMVRLLGAFEDAHGLPAGRLRFEVQVETPQVVLGPQGTVPLATLPALVPGRISGLHYGTYDYSAALGVAAAYQSMEHPAADLAKGLMQLAVAGTGIRLSDGSTNVLPVGGQVPEAWALHARLVRRSLERGFYQGWDLHPAQLPTRYAATYAFYRDGLDDAAARLVAYRRGTGGAVLDEPATARALADFVLRGHRCGAVGADELADRDLDPAWLDLLARGPRVA